MLWVGLVTNALFALLVINKRLIHLWRTTPTENRIITKKVLNFVGGVVPDPAFPPVVDLLQVEGTNVRVGDDPNYGIIGYCTNLKTIMVAAILKRTFVIPNIVMRRHHSGPVGKI